MPKLPTYQTMPFPPTPTGAAVPNIVEVTVLTGTLDNTAQGGNNNKFYRLYFGKDWCITQYGSMRNGIRGGAFKPENMGTATNAERQARAVFQAKVNKGYDPMPEFKMDVLESDWNNAITASRLGPMLDDEAAKGGGFNNVGRAVPPKPNVKNINTPEPVSDDAVKMTRHMAAQALDKLAEDALATLSMAATEPIKAVVAAQRIKEAREEIAASLRKVDSYLETLDMLIEESV